MSEALDIIAWVIVLFAGTAVVGTIAAGIAAWASMYPQRAIIAAYVAAVVALMWAIWRVAT